MQRRISDLIADEYPVAVIARKVGITRQDVYNFLSPEKYDYALTEEKLALIATFEGRSLRSVREEYQSRRAA